MVVAILFFMKFASPQVSIGAVSVIDSIYSRAEGRMISTEANE